MKYDPVKDSLSKVVGRSVLLRQLFYTALGVFFLREWYVKRELRVLLKSGSVKRLWDAGSGFGQYSYYCARRRPDLPILAVDVKKEEIEECTRFFARRRLSGVTFAVEDLTEAQHVRAFDLILSVDVMEHIEDDVAVFRNFAASLAPGGRVLINTPSSFGGSDVHGPEDASFIEEHARTGYEPSELRTKLADAGLVVEKQVLTYGRLGSTAWRLGIKYPIQLVNISKLFFLLLPFYYLITLPFTLTLMYLDYRGHNARGTGLLVIARKPDRGSPAT